MHTISRREWLLLGFILAYSLVPAVGGLLRAIELLGGLAIVPRNPRAISDPLPILIHILASLVFCILGAVQFLHNIRESYPALHRSLGRIVAIAGIASALSGLWMTVFLVFPQALQGPSLYWSRVVLGIAMAALILFAIHWISVGKVRAHKAAMVRAYAIGQGASTQAVLGIAAMILLGQEATGTLRDALMITSWGINLLVAEMILRAQPHARPSFF